jgi:site-specific DNA-methyltransferase (adenine-specific)
MKITDKITITNEDNMALMARYPDNYFDLAIVDPPYGIDASKKFGLQEFGWTQYKRSDWDSEIPKKRVF